MYFYTSGFTARAILPPTDFWQCLETLFGCYNSASGGVTGISSRQRSGILLNNLEGTGLPSQQQRITMSKISIGLSLRNTGVRQHFTIWSSHIWHSVQPSCAELNSVLLNSCPARTYECDLLWKLVLCRCNQIKTGSYWIKVDPNPMTGILTSIGKCEHAEGRRPCEDRGNAWSCVITSQETPKTTGNHHKPETRKDSSLEPSGGTWPLASEF